MRLIDIESELFLNEMREKQNACKEMIQSSDGATYTWTERDHWEGVYGIFVEMALTLKQQPAVDATPVKHGRWTEQHVDYASDCAIDEIQELKCSVCGLYHTTPYMYNITHYKFCPNCGAKMDLDDEQ